MKPIRHRTRAGLVGSGILYLAIGGCVDYAVETTLDPDGSGTRTIQVDVTDSSGQLEKYGLSPEEFREVMHFSNRQGWSHETEVQRDGDTVHVFRFEKRMADLGSWSDANGEIAISGVPPGRAQSTLGYLTLGDLLFQNRIWIRVEGSGSKSSTLRYQEQFLWENGTDALIEFVLKSMEGSLQEAYPRLSERERGELLGFARASLWSAIEEGILDADGDEEDRLWDRVVDRTSSQGIKIVGEHYPEAREESLREHLDVFSGEGEGTAGEELDQLLPGMSLAMNTNIVMRLTMPGQVTNTNAHKREGSTLVWEFSPTDALAAPIVLIAESVVDSGR